MIEYFNRSGEAFCWRPTPVRSWSVCFLAITGASRAMKQQFNALRVDLYIYFCFTFELQQDAKVRVPHSSACRYSHIQRLLRPTATIISPSHLLWILATMGKFSGYLMTCPQALPVIRTKKRSFPCHFKAPWMEPRCGSFASTSLPLYFYVLHLFNTQLPWTKQQPIIALHFFLFKFYLRLYLMALIDLLRIDKAAMVPSFWMTRRQRQVKRTPRCTPS